MIQLVENKSKIWFKVFTPTLEVIDDSAEAWEFPTFDGLNHHPTRTLDFSTILAQNPITGDRYPDRFGTWLVNDPLSVFNPKYSRLVVAKLVEAPTHEELGVIWVSRVKLLRFANILDHKYLNL